MLSKIGPVNTSFPSAARWLSRVVFLMLVLGGVLVMHTLVAQPVAGGASAVGSEPAAMSVSMSELGGSQSPAQHCGSIDCADHSVIHGCVAVLTAVGAALVLMLLTRDVRGEFGRKMCTSRTGRIQGRAPPWSPLSLEKLSVLRL